MNYIVLDLEWNQPTHMNKIITKPVLLHGEIIQIGAVKLNEAFGIVDTFKIMVAPQYYKKMNAKVRRVTSITDEDLQYGFPFPTAFKHFRKWCGDDFTFLTWGFDDIEVLESNLTIHEMGIDWIPGTYNLQMIFDHQFKSDNRQTSLLKAMEIVGEEALSAHDALHDARNTATLCKYIDMNSAVATYYDNLNSITLMKVNLYDAVNSLHLVKNYSHRNDAFSDAEVVTFRCINCGAEAICLKFYKQSTDKYISIAHCENGDEYFVRLRFSKMKDGKVKASRIVYECNDEYRALYEDRRDRAIRYEEWYRENFMFENGNVSTTLEASM